MSNVEITALETIRKEIQKLRDKYQIRAEKEREKVNEIFVTIKGEKCYSNDDIFGWYEAGYINSRQYDKYRDKLEAKKNAAGEVDNKTKSEMIVKILSTMSRNFSAEIATIKEEETEKEESED